MTEPQADPRVVRSLSAHQTRILNLIFGLWVWIAGSVGVLSTAIFVLSGFALPFLGLAIGAAAITGSVYWSKRSLGSPRFDLGILSIVVSLYATSVLMAFLFHSGTYAFYATTILCMILVAMANKESMIAWIGSIGTVLFLVFAILENQELIERFHFMPGSASDLVTPLLVTCVTPVAGLFTYLLTKTMRQSVVDAERRRAIAEAARAQQAATLAKVEQQSAEQARLLDLVRDLETPVIPLLEGVLVLPIVGHLDSLRLTNLTQALLERVAEERAHTVVIDVTAVSLIDTATANHLIQLTKGVRLLGAECIMTGIRAEVAQTLVSLGVTWESVKTAASLRDGLARLLEESAS